VLGHAGFCLGFHAVNRGFKGLTNTQMAITNSKINKWLSCKVNKNTCYMGYFHEKPSRKWATSNKVASISKGMSSGLGLSKGKIQILAPYLVGLCIFPFPTTVATMVFYLATKKSIFHFTCSWEGPNGWFVLRWLLQLPPIGVVEGRPTPRPIRRGVLDVLNTKTYLKLGLPIDPAHTAYATNLILYPIIIICAIKPYATNYR
jgi:hypothetical protein